MKDIKFIKKFTKNITLICVPFLEISKSQAEALRKEYQEEAFPGKERKSLKFNLILQVEAWYLYWMVTHK